MSASAIRILARQQKAIVALSAKLVAQATATSSAIAKIAAAINGAVSSMSATPGAAPAKAEKPTRAQRKAAEAAAPRRVLPAKVGKIGKTSKAPVAAAPSKVVTVAKSAGKVSKLGHEGGLSKTSKATSLVKAPPKKISHAGKAAMVRGSDSVRAH